MRRRDDVTVETLAQSEEVVERLALTIVDMRATLRRSRALIATINFRTRSAA